MRTELTDDQILVIWDEQMIDHNKDLIYALRLIIAADRAQRQAVPPERSSECAVMQRALDALINSVDLVSLAHTDAIDLYSRYPSLARKITALKHDLDTHEAAITALLAAIAQPAHESIASDAIEYVAQPVQPNNLEAAVFEAWGHYERTGSVCRFEGRSMIYASTLEEIYEAAISQPKETK